MERVLVVQLADIGDLILSTPALAALRQARPDAHITLLAGAHAAPVVRGLPLVDDIFTLDRQAFNSSTALLKPANLRRLFGLGRFDTVVYFHHFTLRLGTFKFALIALAARAKRRIGLDNDRAWFLTDTLLDAGFGARHQAQYWLDLVGLLGADSTPRPAVVAADPLSPQLSTLFNSALVVAIHPGSGGYSRARRWDAAGFAAVADALHDEYGAEIVLVGGPDDDTASVKAAMRNEPLDLSGQTTLPQLAALLAKCRLFIGADSGVMHLAAAVGVPVVAVFGPSNAAAWGPWPPDGAARVVRSAPECSPCSYVGHGIGLREGCPARTCMRMVTPEHVLAAARSLLDGTPPAVHELPRRMIFSRRIHILGLPVDGITYPEWLDRIESWTAGAGDRTCHHVCTINPEFTMIARRDPNFWNILHRADLCVPDGVGLLWAARRLGHRLPERVTGSDGVPKIAERAARLGWRLFLLGAAPGVAEQAGAVLQARFPGLDIAGIYGGSPAPDEEDAIVERVNASGADILFVAYGAPEQDKWIARNLPRLKVAMAMGVGGAFDFLAGVVPRAPLWMQRAGLEWLFRLFLQPWRFKRMLRLPRFVLAVLQRGAG
ncbi:MAG: WecB/TagA/CpsF family glycosyltransferase [Chloroflexi bacterium]|nr:WecB/TagA/CpsF family glycosyltransferase [Chloroflexota bacterium]